MTRQDAIDRLLDPPHLALAGASRTGKKFGNTVLRELRAKGYEIICVHPDATEIDGTRCVREIRDLPPEVRSLIVVVPPDRALELVRAAHEHGIRNVWLQQGAASPSAIAFAGEYDMNLVHGECILMFAQPAGIHRLHHWVWGLFGKLPEGASSRS